MLSLRKLERSIIRVGGGGGVESVQLTRDAAKTEKYNPNFCFQHSGNQSSINYNCSNRNCCSWTGGKGMAKSNTL